MPPGRAPEDAEGRFRSAEEGCQWLGDLWIHPGVPSCKHLLGARHSSCLSHGGVIVTIYR